MNFNKHHFLNELQKAKAANVSESLNESAAPLNEAQKLDLDVLLDRFQDSDYAPDNSSLKDLENFIDFCREYLGDSPKGTILEAKHTVNEFFSIDPDKQAAFIKKAWYDGLHAGRTTTGKYSLRKWEKFAKEHRINESINESKTKDGMWIVKLPSGAEIALPKSFTVSKTMPYSDFKLYKGTYKLKIAATKNKYVYYNQAFKSEVTLDDTDIINFDRIGAQITLHESINEARAYNLKASEFGGNTMAEPYKVKDDAMGSWRVHSTYAVDQVSGENDPDARDVLFFEVMPYKDEIVVKLGGINNLKRSNGSAYGKFFSGTKEDFKKDPKKFAKEASDFLTKGDQLKWANKNVFTKSEGKKIKWAMKDDYSSVIEDLIKKAI